MQDKANVPDLLELLRANKITVEERSNSRSIFLVDIRQKKPLNPLCSDFSPRTPLCPTSRGLGRVERLRLGSIQTQGQITIYIKPGTSPIFENERVPNLGI